MQHSHKQQQEKQKALQEELQTLRQKKEREKEEQGRQDQEVLALLTQKAERAEESARQFSVKLQEKVSVQRSCGAVLDPGTFERWMGGGGGEEHVTLMLRWVTIQHLCLQR